MAELAEVATEAVADVAEGIAGDATTVAETARGMSGQDIRLVAGGLIIGAATAAFITFRLTRKQLETKYEKIAEDEIDEMREHFRKRMLAKEEKPKLSGLAETSEKVDKLGYATPVPPDRPTKPPVPTAEPEVVEAEVIEEQTVNIFKERQVDDDWNYEAELALRTPNYPYVIHADEQHEKGYAESTLTYYEIDDVLCDEQDKPIDNKDDIVGEENLTKFGHGSGDPSIVYIRNDALNVEIELIKSPNSYTEEVHGFKHSEPHRRVKFDDEA